jgi:hypothetical protein
MAGPWARNVEMSDESRAWVESIKEKVRIASGNRPEKPASAASPANPAAPSSAEFGDLGKVGNTKRLFKRPT